MDNFEIVLKNFPKENLDKFFNSELLIHKEMIRGSHFYDNINKKDLTINEVSSFSKVLSPTGCGSISFSDFIFGVSLGNTVITFSFDEKNGDIVINFEKEDVFIGDKSLVIDNLKNILEKGLKIKKEYSIPIVLFGMEPAEDVDTCLIRLDTNNIDLLDLVEKLYGIFNPTYKGN